MFCFMGISLAQVETDTSSNVQERERVGKFWKCLVDAPNAIKAKNKPVAFDLATKDNALDLVPHRSVDL